MLIDFCKEMQPLSFCLSQPLKEEVKIENRDGIMSILEVDCEQSKPSLRRTLSADMASKNCQTQFSFLPLKTVSSEALSLSQSSMDCDFEKDSEPCSWNHKCENQEPGDFDFWASFMADKPKDEITSDVHQPLERSSSSLSQWSLEMCTESLGSETGSEGYCSYPFIEADESVHFRSDEEGDKLEEKEKPSVEADGFFTVTTASKKSPARAFPPPIPSLNSAHGSSLLLQSHRDNGKLVVEAVSVMNKCNFRTERQNGRLVLSLIGSRDESDDWSSDENETKEDQFEVEMDAFGNEAEIEENHGDEQAKVSVPTTELSLNFPRTMNMNPLSIIMNKPGVLINQNPRWARKYAGLQEEDDALKQVSSVARSLPAAPLLPMMMTTQRSAPIPTTTKYGDYLNVYVKSSVPEVSYISPGRRRFAKNPTLRYNIVDNDCDNSLAFKTYKVDEALELLDDSRDHYKAWQNGCKESRRLLSVWKSPCIATS